MTHIVGSKQLWLHNIFHPEILDI